MKASPMSFSPSLNTALATPVHAVGNILAFPVPARASGLRRPSALVRAARAGQAMWKRDRDLRRVLRADHTPAPGSALPRLRAEEDALNGLRLAGDARYDVQRHVLLVIAILAELRAVASYDGARSSLAAKQ